MMSADQPPPRHLPTPIRRALADHELTTEAVRNALRQSRMCVAPLTADEAAAVERTRVIDTAEARKLVESGELSPEAVKAVCARVRSSAAANAREATKVTQSDIIRGLTPPRGSPIRGTEQRPPSDTR